MITSKTVGKDTELFRRGQTLLEAAQAYWQIYRKELGASAVVYLESDDGKLVVFTRGEYKAAIMDAVSEIHRDPDALFI